ncbi:MAG TPA: alanyl-tRNA editing protein [Gemmatimonadaceae bacterium]
MTERLYYTDAWLREFDARVVDRRDEGRRIYLDRSAFYPTSGGQPHDTGTLGGVAVIDVVDEEDRVAHLLARPLEGDTARGEIDWTRRFDYMQQHTGQHLLSALFHDRHGWPTVSVHFGPESSTLDLETPSVDDGVLREVEQVANAIVAEARPVTVSFEEAERAAGLRKASARPGTLRIVTIEGIDRSACGGTHLSTTSQIGPVLLRRQEKVKRNARIEFVCGGRAVARARRDFEALQRVARGMSAAIDDVPALVEAQAAQLREAQGLARQLQERLDAYRARERYDQITPGPDGVRRLCERLPTGSPDQWRSFALAFCGLPRAVFVAAVDDPPAILVAAADDAGIDAGRTLRAALEGVGGRGGGSPRLAQGALPSREALEHVLKQLGA